MMPNDWSVSSLDELADKIGDGLHGTPKYDGAGEVHFVNGNNIKNGKIILDSSTKKISQDEFVKLDKKLNHNSLLLSINGTIGNVAFYRNEKIALGKSAAYITLKNDVSRDFVFYCLSGSSVQSYFTNELTGSTIKNLSLKTIRSTKIPIPPRIEQEKIAKILSTWDEAIEKIELQISKKIKQKKSLMNNILTGKKRFPEFGKPSSTCDEIPNDWMILTLSDIIVEYKEKTKSNNQYEVMTSSRQGLILQSDYYDGENRITNRDNTGFNIIPPDYFTYRSRSDDGSFFFNRNRLGKTGCISTYYPVFKFKDSSNEFFYYLLNLNNKIYEPFSVGTSQKVLSFNALRTIKFKVPPKVEQEKIARVLTNLDFELYLLIKKLGFLRSQKQELMQQLLTGKKRVRV